MFNKATKTALLSAAVLSGAMVAQAASASLITQWDYDIMSGFSDFTQSSGDGSGVSGSGSGYLGEPTKLAWSDVNGNTSSISIDGKVSGSNLVTNSPGVPGATFTHNNQIIRDTSATLKTFKLNTNLDLTANAPPSEAGTKPSPGIPTISFNSFFSETPNVAGDCAVNDGGTPCSDIFVLTNSTGGNTVGSNGQYVLSQDFSAGGGLYTAFLSIDGLGVLGDSACAEAGASNGCIGLTTFEDNFNQFTTNVRIVSRAVPEPGSLLMLAAGLGLVGFGFAARRRRNSQQS